MQVQTVETPQLGDRSYLVHDGTTGVVIDAQRDLDRMEDQIAQAGVTVAWVLETHVHNDYVSGGAELARRSGARYAMAAADGVTVEHQPVADGDVLDAGDLRVTVVATPGHTEHHVAYVVEADGDDPVVFTGGNLLYGTVGRTDLVDPDLTDRLTHQQYRSARQLAGRLPDPTEVYPTHGFGSFCSSTPASEKDTSTLAEERSSNEALTTNNEDTFVEQLIAGLTDSYPRYYAHMATINRQGAPAADLSAPAPVDPATLRARLKAGEWVIDLRDRGVFAAHHLRGSVNFELSENFSTYLGWIVPWDAPLTIVADNADQVADAQRDLARIGIDRDRLTGAATGPIDALADGATPTSFPHLGWEDLRDALADPATAPIVVDVRRGDEYRKRHIDGAVNMPIHELPDHVNDLPDGQLWVHCASGYRAAIGASILEGSGHDVVHVDDNWPPPDELGLPVTR